MATIVGMPRLGSNMTDGVIEKWFKKEGDWVEKGEPLVCILTEKVSYEYESPASGVLRKILRTIDEVVRVNEPIAIIGATGEALPDLGSIQPAEPEKGMEPPQDVRTGKIATEKGSFIASPLVKKMAQERGIDLANIVGTGPGGRITKEDVMKYGEKKGPPLSSPEIPFAEVIPVGGIRRTIGQRMSESTKNIPHFYLSIETDMTQLLELRGKLLERIEKEKGVRVSLTDLLVKIISRAMEKHPLVNSTFEDQQIKVYKEINIGVAMAGKDGLIVPVVHKANECSIGEISSRTKELNQKIQDGTLSLDDVTGGTFTLSNLGMYGVDQFTPIINPPQCAILAVGRVSNKPVIVDDKVAIRPMAWLTLSIDHRILDGVQGAEFLGEIKGLIENPHLLLV